MSCTGLEWKVNFFACALDPISCHLLRDLRLTFIPFPWVIKDFLLAGSFYNSSHHKKLFLDPIFPSSYSPFISLLPFPIMILKKIIYTPCLWFLFFLSISSSTPQKWLLPMPPVLCMLLNPMISFQDMSAAFHIRNTPGNTLPLASRTLHSSAFPPTSLAPFKSPLAPSHCLYLIQPLRTQDYFLGPGTQSLELFAMILISMVISSHLMSLNTIWRLVTPKLHLQLRPFTWIPDSYISRPIQYLHLHTY